MKLIEETPGRRIYESEDGGFVEVRAEIRGWDMIIGKQAVDQFPELGAHVARMTVHALQQSVIGLEVIPDSGLVRSAIELQWHYLEGENGEPLRDEDGEMIIDETQEPTELVRYTAECGIWPVLR